jgi:hypothetical protein
MTSRLERLLRKYKEIINGEWDENDEMAELEESLYKQFLKELQEVKDELSSL